MKALKSALAVAGVTTAAIFAFATPAFAGGGGGGDDDGFNQSSHHNYGFLDGTQVGIPIDLDVDISCNAIGILGFASSYCD